MREILSVLIWLKNIYIWDSLVVVDIGITVAVRNGLRKSLSVIIQAYPLLNLMSGRSYHMIETNKGLWIVA